MERLVKKIFSILSLLLQTAVQQCGVQQQLVLLVLLLVKNVAHVSQILLHCQVNKRLTLIFVGIGSLNHLVSENAVNLLNAFHLITRHVECNGQLANVH